MKKKLFGKRVVDMNENFRFIDINTKGVAKDFAREDGFDITVASEVMAIFCLSNDLSDLEKELEILQLLMIKIINQSMQKT